MMVDGMPGFPIDRMMPAVIAFGVLLLGSWVISQEAAHYFAAGTKIQRLAAMPDHPPFAGVSILTKQDNLLDCVFALDRRSSLEVLYMPEAFRTELPARCSAMAMDAVTQMPTFSYGWFVLAYTDALAEDWAAMNKHLYMTRVTGQTSQWVAEQRVALAESYREHLDPSGLDGNQADLELLVRSQRGIGSIAKRYVNDPTFRERITAIVETMPEDIQHRFIGVLRYLTR